MGWVIGVNYELILKSVPRCSAFNITLLNRHYNLGNHSGTLPQRDFLHSHSSLRGSRSKANGSPSLNAAPVLFLTQVISFQSTYPCRICCHQCLRGRRAPNTLALPRSYRGPSSGDASAMSMQLRHCNSFAE
jgi:hypothetical protein